MKDIIEEMIQGLKNRQKTIAKHLKNSQMENIVKEKKIVKRVKENKKKVEKEQIDIKFKVNIENENLFVNF